MKWNQRLLGRKKIIPGTDRWFGNDVKYQQFGALMILELPGGRGVKTLTIIELHIYLKNKITPLLTHRRPSFYPLLCIWCLQPFVWFLVLSNSLTWAWWICVLVICCRFDFLNINSHWTAPAAAVIFVLWSIRTFSSCVFIAGVLDGVHR